MGDIINFDNRKNGSFKAFINANRDEIYANAPKVSSISLEDEWADETEWDEMFQQLSAKEN